MHSHGSELENQVSLIVVSRFPSMKARELPVSCVTFQSYSVNIQARKGNLYLSKAGFFVFFLKETILLV